MLVEDPLAATNEPAIAEPAVAEPVAEASTAETSVASPADAALYHTMAEEEAPLVVLYGGDVDVDESTEPIAIAVPVMGNAVVVSEPAVFVTGERVAEAEPSIAVSGVAVARTSEGLLRPTSAIPLRVIAQQLRSLLSLDGSIPIVVDAACAALDVGRDDGSLMERARRCHSILNSRGAGPPAVDSGVAAAAPSSSDDDAAATSESPPTPALGVPLATGTAVATSLVCRGVEFGFQYLNFFGEWELATEPTDQLYNGRPHYIHSTMYGDCAHLFHCIDLLYHVPRWVIGPSPSGQNGWAFCESDAPTPHQIIDSWMSWDGFSWSRSLSMRFVPYSEAVAAELLEEESELERRFVRGAEG